ncbi:MAG TPA: hypothetical protein VLJ58_04015 [Ramlibacter sp.]|nr:hypothetical protein [Ramlibacter sp.]
MDEVKAKRRGFAAMDADRQHEIALAGSKAAKASGKAHRFTSDEARAAVTKRHEERRSKRAAVLMAWGKLTG